MSKIFSANLESRPKHNTRSFVEMLKPAEVVDVVLDDSHESYNPDGNIMVGSIKARMLDTQRGKAASELSWYAPLDLNDVKIPLIGEVVILMQAPNRNIIKSNRSQDYYYIGIVSLNMEISNNATPGFSKQSKGPENLTSFSGNTGTGTTPKIGKYVPDVYNPPLIAFEGDKLIQGRWGSSLRFTNSSPGSRNNSFWNSKGTNGDPIIIISNGHDSDTEETYVENINKDSATIALTSTQPIELDPANKLPLGFKNVNQYINGQVVINSDRVVINSKSDDVIISAKTAVGISTPEWKVDFTSLVDILETVVVELNDFMTAKKPAPTGAGPTGPTPGAAKLTAMVTKLKQLKQ